MSNRHAIFGHAVGVSISIFQFGCRHIICKVGRQCGVCIKGATGYTLIYKMYLRTDTMYDYRVKICVLMVNNDFNVNN